jgi:hypothetical protein
MDQADIDRIADAVVQRLRSPEFRSPPRPLYAAVRNLDNGGAIYAVGPKMFQHITSWAMYGSMVTAGLVPDASQIVNFGQAEIDSIRAATGA